MAQTHPRCFNGARQSANADNARVRHGQRDPSRGVHGVPKKIDIGHLGLVARPHHRLCATYIVASPFSTTHRTLRRCNIGRKNIY
jgi:hypothetical protein